MTRHENGLKVGPVNMLSLERGRQQSFLKELFNEDIDGSQRNTGSMTKTERESILKKTKKQIENNIETLDYLRGISSLEKGFVKLADCVVNTSLKLTHECNDVNREALSPERLTTEVEQSWQHISELGNTVQAHVTQAKRYHLFYLELDRVNRDISSLSEKVMHQSIEFESKLSNGETFHQLETYIIDSLKQFVQLYLQCQKLELQSQIVAPLHRRYLMSDERHSGVLLNAITLPDGGTVRIGSDVLVRGNTVGSRMHREWFLEDENCRPLTTVPAPFVWLNSPDSTPSSSQRKSPPINSRQKSYTAPSTLQRANNRKAIKSLHNRLLVVWDELCSKYQEILREKCTKLLEGVPTFNEKHGAGESKDESVEKLLNFMHKERKWQFDSDDEINYDDKLIDAKIAILAVPAIDAFTELLRCLEMHAPVNSSEFNQNSMESEYQFDKLNQVMYEQTTLPLKTTFSNLEEQVSQVNVQKPAHVVTSVDCSRKSRSIEITASPLIQSKKEEHTKARDRSKHRRGYSQPPRLAKYDTMTQISTIKFPKERSLFLKTRSPGINQLYELNNTRTSLVRKSSTPIFRDSRNSVIDRNILKNQAIPVSASLNNLNEKPLKDKIDRKKDKADSKKKKDHHASRSHSRKLCPSLPKKHSKNRTESNLVPVKLMSFTGESGFTTSPRNFPVKYTPAIQSVEKLSWVETGTPTGLLPTNESVPVDLTKEDMKGYSVSTERSYTKHNARPKVPLTDTYPYLSVNTLDSGCFTESSAPVTCGLDEDNDEKSVSKHINAVPEVKVESVIEPALTETVATLSKRPPQVSCLKKTKLSNLVDKPEKNVSPVCQTNIISANANIKHVLKYNNELSPKQTKRNQKINKPESLSRQLKGFSVSCQHGVCQTSIGTSTDLDNSLQFTTAIIGTPAICVLKYGKKVQVGKSWCSTTDYSTSGEGKIKETAETQTHCDFLDTACSPHEYVNLSELQSMYGQVLLFNMSSQTEKIHFDEPSVECCQVSIEKAGYCEEAPELNIIPSDFELSMRYPTQPKIVSTNSTWKLKNSDKGLQTIIAGCDVAIQTLKEYIHSNCCHQFSQTDLPNAPRLSGFSCELHLQQDNETDMYSNQKQASPPTVIVGERNKAGFYRFYVNFEASKCSMYSQTLPIDMSPSLITPTLSVDGATPSCDQHSFSE